MSALVAGLAWGTLLVQLLLISAFLVFVLRKIGIDLEPELLEKAEEHARNYYRELAFLVVLIATSGSLYMSNVLGWEPCRLCWFQRIAVYPMVVLLGVALLLEKDDVADYALPLAMIGIPVSAYHYLVQRIDQFHSAGCSVFSVSCSTEYTFYFGYITVPMMALTAMVAVLVLMWRFSSRKG